MIKPFTFEENRYDNAFFKLFCDHPPPAITLKLAARAPGGITKQFLGTRPGLAPGIPPPGYQSVNLLPSPGTSQIKKILVELELQ